MAETQSTMGYQTSNVDYTTPSIVAIRLNNDPFLHEFYRFISGRTIVREMDSTGTIIEKVKEIGKARANDFGVQEIMSQILSIVNTAGVQGNFDREQYDKYIFDAHVDMVMRLISNREEWGIKTSDVHSIVDMFVQTIRTFMTRPIDNKERESYNKSMQSQEQTTIASKSKIPLLRGD